MRVVVALLIREAQGRYSQETLGFFWTIAEPLILTCGVILLWTVSGRGEGHGKVGVFAMGLTGYSHIQLWRMTVLSAIGSIRGNAWLYYHHNVNAFDVFLARSLLLSLSILASFVLLATVGILFDLMDPVRDPGLIVAAWCLDTLFCMSFAMVMAGLSETSEFVDKILHPAMYITLPLTGAFTMTSWLPPRVRVVIDWSPLANLCEMFRAGVFPLSVKTSWSLPLIVGSTLILFAIGLPLMSYARSRITVA
jgi:capsular polysaccharide transport system permease protein